MYTILLFGAGKSATILIQYLLEEAETGGWNLIVVDANLSLAKTKVGDARKGKAVSFDILNVQKRRKYIQEATIVVSLLPPALHFEVAKDCLLYRKNLLTASYVDDKIRGLQPEIEQKGLLFLCEMGLDPGIDHMSAKKMIDSIQEEGGKIISFLSHCGGLVSPESDDNPWHYKISWNPRNIVMAGKSGAVYRQNNQEVHLSYEQLFSSKRWVSISNSEDLCWYPNRDSLNYATLYGLDQCPTFIRTTLRHPDFINGWKKMIDLKLTDETIQYETDDMTLMEFFQQHMAGSQIKDESKIENFINESSFVNEIRSIEQEEKNKINDDVTLTLTNHDEEKDLILKQLMYLGWNDNNTRINKGKCSAADVLQLALEKKLSLKENDKDRVIMLHEIVYEKQSRKYLKRSLMQLEGLNNQYTAMAKTVGMPLGIAVKLILSSNIKITGLQLPLLKEIYEPVLNELEKVDICFSEEEKIIE